MLPQVAVHECDCTAAPEGTNTCGVWAVSWKELGSLLWWVTENREGLPKADEVTGLRLCLCGGTITSYLPAGVLLSSPCNCDLSLKTRPLSRWQIEAQRSDSLGYTSVGLSRGPVGSLYISSTTWLPGLYSGQVHSTVQQTDLKNYILVIESDLLAILFGFFCQSCCLYISVILN